MATTHIPYDRGSTFGRDIEGYLDNLQRAERQGPDLIAAMAHMIDGDGSDAAHFTLLAGKYGFPTNADAKAGYDELASVVAKLSSDASQTNVAAAVAQVLAKFGVV